MRPLIGDSKKEDILLLAATQNVIPAKISSCISSASKKSYKDARAIHSLQPDPCYCDIVEGVSLLLMP
jgi:hypothetical protein